MKFNLNYVIIGALILIIVWMRMCQTPKVVDEKPKVESKTEVIYRPQFLPIEVSKPGPRYTIHDTVSREVDTTAILKAYFNELVYIDTIKLDTVGWVRIKETISENRIKDRETSAYYKFPEIKNTTTITLPPVRSNQVYLGVSIGGSKENPINYFGSDVYLKTKQDKLYTIGMGIGNNTLNYRAGLAWKIKLK